MIGVLGAGVRGVAGLRRRLQYLLIAALFYLAGTALFVWARRQARQKIFRGVEPVLVGVVAVGAAVAVVGLVSGWLTI